MKYSPSTHGFYDPAIHGKNIPADAVDLSAAEYSALLSGQRSGQAIVAGPGGKPILQGPPPRTLESARAEKLAALADRRYAAETAGIVVSGVAVKTDRESQATLTGALVLVQRNPEMLINWKGTVGWVEVGNVQIEAMADAVGAHVQASFTAERVHAEAIAALSTIAAVDGYDIEVGWPA